MSYFSRTGMNANTSLDEIFLYDRHFNGKEISILMANKIMPEYANNAPKDMNVHDIVANWKFHDHNKTGIHYKYRYSTEFSIDEIERFVDENTPPIFANIGNSHNYFDIHVLFND
jgi:hypothetical protein